MTKKEVNSVIDNRERTGKRMTLIDEGITVRDYFAAHALIGLISSPKVFNMPDGSKMDGEENMAKVSYWVADAMLKERAKC